MFLFSFPSLDSFHLRRLNPLFVVLSCVSCTAYFCSLPSVPLACSGFSSRIAVWYLLFFPPLFWFILYSFPPLVFFLGRWFPAPRFAGIFAVSCGAPSGGRCWRSSSPKFGFLTSWIVFPPPHLSFSPLYVCRWWSHWLFCFCFFMNPASLFRLNAGDLRFSP